MRYLELFEKFLESELDDLINLLMKFSIPIRNWGTGKSKTIKHLLKEIKDGECRLEQKGDRIVRNIEFVGVKIYYIDEENIKWVLKEDRQEFSDGRVRRRKIPSSVSEKMKPGENPRLAAIRGVHEELGVNISEDQLSRRKDLFFDGLSTSYPGLETKYLGHKFVCYFTRDQFIKEGYIEIQRDKKTYFVWYKV